MRPAGDGGSGGRSAPWLHGSAGLGGTTPRAPESFSSFAATSRYPGIPRRQMPEYPLGLGVVPLLAVLHGEFIELLLGTFGRWLLP